MITTDRWLEDAKWVKTRIRATFSRATTLKLPQVGCYKCLEYVEGIVYKHPWMHTPVRAEGL